MAGLDPQAVALALGGEATGDQVLAPGPGHSAKDRSLSVLLDPDAPDGFLVYSFSDGDWQSHRDYVRERVGLPAFKPNGGGRTASAEPKKLVAIHDYRDADGTLLSQKLKYEPKDFSQRRPDGKGGWSNKLGRRRVIYRWPEILKYPDAPVFVCEGEKDADRVATLNLCATTADNWTDDCVTALAGRDVIILEDNDDAGRKKALATAQALHGTAKTIRVVSLPGLPDKGDVSDWLAADPQRAEKDKLAELCLEAPLWKPAPSLQWLDMSNWDNEPVPERKWAIRDRVPLNQVGLFSGEGGAGKSIIELMKDVAHVAAPQNWLDSVPEPGPAFYLGAEDDTDELQIRLNAIAKHYGTTFKELTARGLMILPLLGKDAVLCAPSKSGRIEPTELYWRIFEAAGDIKPRNISIDTLSRAFAGNEIDRVQVYAFAMHMQALAKVAGGSVTVLSHPSLAGMASGSGISGSTAWHGAFRFRQYLKGIKDDEGEQPENDLRELEFKKNQYGPLGESIALRYTNGLFLPLAGVSDLERRAREAKADMTFSILLKRFCGQGRNVSHKKAAKNYAPKQFADEQEAKTHKLRKSELEAAMQRLFAIHEIHVATYGRPSQPTQRLAVGTLPEPNEYY